MRERCTQLQVTVPKAREIYTMTIFLKSRKLIVTIICVWQSLTGLAQNYKAFAKDSIIHLFITSQKVVDRFNHCNVAPTGVLLILDPDNLLGKANFSTWLGHDLKIVNTGPIIDSIKKYEPYFVLKNQNNVFILREYNFNKQKSLRIHFPYNNIVVEARLKNIKGTFYLDKFESAVL